MAKLTATEEEELVKKLATSAAAPPKPQDDEDEDDQDDEEEDDDQKKKDAKAAAEAAATPPPAKAATGKPKAAPVIVDDDEDDVPRGRAAAADIVEYCALAGQEKLAPKFIAKNMSAREVIERLQDMKASKPSNREAISTAHDTSVSAGLPALDNLLRTTVGFAAQTGMNRPHAMARAMETMPELYKAYCDEQQDAMESRRSREAYMAELTKRIGKGSMILSRNTITPPQA